MENYPWYFIGVIKEDYQENPSYLRISQIDEYKVLSDNVGLCKRMYDDVFKGLDTMNISYEERMKQNLLGHRELTYGEISYLHFIPVLEVLRPGKGDVFWDLGCGAGRALITAALNFPQTFKKCNGIELLTDLT